MNAPDEQSSLAEVALAHFAAAGVDATSLAAIARDSNRALGDVVEKFSDCDALFDAAMAQALAPLAADLTRLSRNTEPLPRLFDMLRRIAVVEGPEQLALFCWYRELLDGQPRAARAYDAVLADGVQPLMAAISESQIRGLLQPLPPQFVLVTLLSGIVVPQVIGYGASQGHLGGVHAADNPRNAVFTVGLQIAFAGILTDTARDEFPTLLTRRGGN